MAIQTEDGLDESATSEDISVTLQGALREYISELPDVGKKGRRGRASVSGDDRKKVAYSEISRFIRDAGVDREIKSLLPSDIERYGGSLGSSASDTHKQRVEVVKDFLNFLKKRGYTDESLARYMRVKRSSSNGTRRDFRRRRASEVQITQQGYDEMTDQLEKLREEAIRLTGEIEKAAASGDVRENAPLEAARENQGMVQSRIYHLETILKSATIISEAERGSGDHVQIGSWVTLRKLDDDRTMDYQIVTANEANPLRSKISDNSPVGRAILGHKPDDEVVVKTPSGEQHFRVERIM